MSSQKEAEAEGFEPSARVQNPREKERFSETAAQNPAHSVGGSTARANSQNPAGDTKNKVSTARAISGEDADLAEIVRRWTALPASARGQILAIISNQKPEDI